jgi:hypothetical protein
MEENKEGTNEKLNHSLIKQAGKSIKNVAILLTSSAVLNVLFPLVVSNMKFSRKADVGPKELAYILMGLNICLGIAVIYQFFNAGYSLMGSVSNDNTYDESNIVQSSQKALTIALKLKDSPVALGKLDVLGQDLGKMEWEDAKKACADLGDGWRLPTKEELNILYENKEKIGSINNGYYWSSTEYGKRSAWGQSFVNGYQNHPNHNKFGNVRVVRSIE